jgi:hypothetical protein
VFDGRLLARQRLRDQPGFGNRLEINRDGAVLSLAYAERHRDVAGRSVDYDIPGARS